MDDLQSVEKVVMQLLNRFEQNKIHASWATIGLLEHSSFESLIKNSKGFQINYRNPKYSPYPINSNRYGDIPFEILSGTQEIQKILKSPGQELASHTYSHFYTLEDGQDERDFKQDLSKMKEFSDRFGTHLKSIVFPRNQINPAYLKMCSEKKYIAYRGNQQNPLWASSPYKKESLGKRGKRYLDAYYNISNTQTFSLSTLQTVNGLLNIPASRFFRPISNKQFLESRKIKRIKEEMSQAAINGEIYHLWWHPHNFSRQTEAHFSQLKTIIDHYHQLNTKYGFQSLNMSEIGELKKKI